MKKTFQLEDLDCANCAAKMEDAVSKLDGVVACKVNFMQQNMVLEAEDGQFDTVLKQAQKTIKKIEPDVRILS